MTSCVYIYLYVQYKTRLITECTVHCPMAWDCFLNMDNSLCLALPRLHLLLLGQVCEVVSHSICYCWPSKLDVNRDLTTGVLKIRTKKETIKGKRDCKGTLDRLLALFFLILSIKLHWVCLRMWQLRIGQRSSTNNQAGPGDSVRQQSSATPLLWIRGGYWQWTIHTLYNLSLQNHTPRSLHSDIVIVKLNVKVNPLCLSSNIDSAPHRKLKIMGSTIFVHHTFMVTDFGFSSEM